MARKFGWFVLLYVASVAAIALLAKLIKLWIG